MTTSSCTRSPRKRLKSWRFHGEIENEYGDLLERFVVTTAQRAGLMRLPLAVIQAGIHYLAIGKDPSLVAEWDAAPGVPDAASMSTEIEAGAGRSTGRRSRRSGPGQVIVIVKITKRQGKMCIPNLRDSGIKWNGKHNDYRGIVDAGDVDKLRARFPNCVTVDGQDNHVDDVLNGGALDGIPGASGNPLTTLGPYPTNIDTGPAQDRVIHDLQQGTLRRRPKPMKRVPKLRMR